MLSPGPSAPSYVLHRFSMVTQVPVRTDEGLFVQNGIVFDGVSSEGFSGAATVANHAIPREGSVADHAQVQPRQFSASVYVSTPLDGSQPRGNVSGGVTADFLLPPAWTDNYADGLKAIDAKLYALLGVAMTIYTARNGRLDNFALTSFSSQRGSKGKVQWDLTFQEIRRAAVELVGVPVIPRAEKQAEPSEQECNTSEEASVNEQFEDVSILAAWLGLDEPAPPRWTKRRTNFELDVTHIPDFDVSLE